MSRKGKKKKEKSRKGRQRTVKGEGDELEGGVAEANVEAGGGTARADAGEVEPARHAGLGRCGRPQRRHKVQDQAREQELHEHVDRRREEREGKVAAKHPLVVQRDAQREEVPQADERAVDDKATHDVVVGLFALGLGNRLQHRVRVVVVADQQPVDVMAAVVDVLGGRCSLRVCFGIVVFVEQRVLALAAGNVIVPVAPSVCVLVAIVVSVLSVAALSVFWQGAELDGCVVVGAARQHGGRPHRLWRGHGRRNSVEHEGQGRYVLSACRVQCSLFGDVRVEPIKLLA